MAEVDDLQVKIVAEIKQAALSIEKLNSKLTELSFRLQTLNGSSLVGLANGVQKLGTAMQTMKSVKTSDFSRLANNLNKIAAIDTASMNRLASATRQMSNAFGVLGGSNDSIDKISNLGKAIKQFGSGSVEKAIDNMPKIATSMQQLMTTLSRAPAVSNNLIRMTNALTSFMQAGSNGSIPNLSASLSSYSRTTTTAAKKSGNLLFSLVKLQAGFYAVKNAVESLSSSIETASSLVEVENVVNATFTDMAYKVEDFTDTSIQEFGMSELAAKQYASTFQAMGNAMGISNSSIGDANSFLNSATSGYVGLSDSMSDVSLNLTKLTADMASFYNMEQSDVAEDLEAIFTGQVAPLRQYGLDLTQATLSEWALKNGLDADIQSMSQAEKTMLRYQYVLANTKDSQGDFARTADTWANQTRILSQQLEQLATVVGGTFINALKPVVTALNVVIAKLIQFANAVSDSLGKIFGWKYEESSKGATTYADSLEDVSDSIDDTASSAKKLNKQLASFDELNNLTSSDNSESGSGNSTSSGASGTSSGTIGQWVETDKFYESDLDSLYKLGDYIGSTLENTLMGIDWDEVYQGAKDFGSGLASFLNGLISPGLFGSVGHTIAGALNTALYSLLSFGQEFNFENFGDSIAEAVNEFFDTFDFVALGETLNVWVDGIKETVYNALVKIKWGEVLKGGLETLTTLELDTITFIVGAWWFTHGGAKVTADLIRSAFSSFAGLATIGNTQIPANVTIGLSIATAITFFKLGNWLCENVEGVTKFSELVSSWILDEDGKIQIPQTITVSIAGISIALAGAKLAGQIEKLIVRQLSVAGASEAVATAARGVGSRIWSSITGGITSAPGTLAGIGSKLMSLMTADIGITLASGSVAGIGATIGTALIGGIIAAVGGWHLGQFLYEKITGETIDMSFGEQMAALWDSILNGEFLPALSMTISDIFGTIFNWDETFDLFGAAGECFNDVSEAFQSGDWASIATNLLEGIALGFVGILDFFVEPIRDLFDAIWGGICDIFGIHSPSEEMKPLGENILKGVIEGFKGAFSFIGSAVSGFFGSIYEKITGGLGDVLDWGKSVADKLGSGIKSGVETVGAAAKSLAEKAKSKTKDVLDNAKEWGSDMAEGLSSGIKSMYNNVAEAASGLADKISSFLHFSRPDEGALHDYETWMPDFITGLANGIKDNSYLITNEVSKLAESMSLSGDIRLAPISADSINREISLDSRAINQADANYNTNNNYEYDNQAEISMLQAAVNLLEIIANKEFGITDSAIAKSVKKSSLEYYKRTGQSLITT